MQASSRVEEFSFTFRDAGAAAFDGARRRCNSSTDITVGLYKKRGRDPRCQTERSRISILIPQSGEQISSRMLSIQTI